jgi:tryptophan-rich sensory protein
MTAIAPPPVGTETGSATEASVARDNAAALESLEALDGEWINAGDGRESNESSAPHARSRRASIAALVGFGAVSLLAGAVSGLVNRRPRNKAWYRLLGKPKLTPPDPVFALVWPVLYAGAALSAHRVWKTPPSRERTAALVLWGTQLAFNAAWSPIFFGAHRPRLALANLASNAASLGAYTYAASRIDAPAAALVSPYLGWLGFAGLLNAGIITSNRGIRGTLLLRG